MYLLLKRLVLKVNQQSVNYFVDKLKSYDEIINEKEKRVKDLDELISKKESSSKSTNESTKKDSENVFYYNMSNIKYKDDKIFKRFKEAEEKFTIDNEETIKNFVKEHLDNELLIAYESYSKIKKQFNDEILFTLYTKTENEQLSEIEKILKDSKELIDDFLRVNKKFNLKKFISYLNKIVNDLDPYIYVCVGDKKQNYEYINKYIKTKYDNTIYKGIKIIYKNKMYDYSI